MVSKVIINGKIVDGKGNPWFKGDIELIGERISKIGHINYSTSGKIIDAKGLFVCPGFIDVHTHSDTSFLINNKADSKIRQGVTTEIAGNCGNSAAPITETGREFLIKEIENDGIKCDWVSVGEYLEKVEKNGLPLNFGTYIGHGTIRASVIGFEAREPTKGEIGLMKDLVREGMQDGAFGLSTGLKYAPGCYANTEEIIELCKVVAEFNGIYASHVRNQGDFLVKSIDEAIRVGSETGSRVIISHLKAKGRDNWGKASNVLRIIDEARDNEIDVTFDQYPYPAGSSNLISRTPEWAREGGPDRLLERLKDPVQRKKIESEIVNSEDWHGPENTIIARFDPDNYLEGKTIEEISQIRNKEPVAVVCDLLLEANGIVPVVSFYGWEKDVLEIMKHNTMMVGSDGSSLSNYGILGKGKPHPRNYGTFPRFLGRYVIKNKAMSLDESVRKMTSNPAIRLGLQDRGCLKNNMFADIVIFDPKTLIDSATFENPHQYPKGIDYVIVNGILAVEKGVYTGSQSGKVLKHE